MSHLPEIVLDRLVIAGAISGHTVEEDAAYLGCPRPTLTYRMYSDGEDSRHNLGRFVDAVRMLGAETHISRLVGTVADPLRAGHVRRSDQLCVRVAFGCEGRLGRGVDLVSTRFHACAPSSVPGSWIYPDLRVTGVTVPPKGTVGAYLHHWPQAPATASVLSLAAEPPAPGGASIPVSLLACWLDLLDAAKLDLEIA